MAESLADRLKRIAAEKKAARDAAESESAAKSELIELVTENSESNLEARHKLSVEAILNDRLEPVQATNSGGGSTGVAGEVSDGATGTTSEPDSSNETTIQASTTDSSAVERPGSGVGESKGLEPAPAPDSNVIAGVGGAGTEVQSSSTGSTSTELVSQPSTASSSDHPLAMEFAELEAALLARDPEFKVQLRKIHRHLGQDAELVTQMTEEEISMIVTGLVLFANTEIVEPAKAKSAKAAVKAAGKKAISADDL